MMPTRSVSSPLWNSVTTSLAAATPAGLWQTVQSSVGAKVLWKVKPEAVKSQLSIDSWQLKQPGPVTGIEFAAVSAVGLSWQTLQLVMYVG